MSVEQTLSKAKRHARKGETDLAVEHYKKVLAKYPQNKWAIAGLGELQQQSAPTNSEPVREQLNKLVVLYNRGKFQQLLDDGEILQKHFPDMPFIPNLLGVANFSLERYEQAAANYSRALQLNPDYAEAHNNLGASLYRLEKPIQALASYKKALQIKSDYSEAHNNMGGVLTEFGKNEEALACFLKALQIKPDYADAHNSLGVVYSKLGKTDEAIVHYKNSVLLVPDSKEYWGNFSELLLTISFEAYDEQWANIYLDLLSQKTIVRPKQFAKPIIQLLKQHPSVQKAIGILDSGNIQKATLKICKNLSDIPLFLRIIELAPISDLDIEKLLRALRLVLLLHGDVVTGGQNLLKFQNSLALYSLTNEFVLGETDEEALALQTLEADIERAFSNGEIPNCFSIACLASYRPLHKFEWAQKMVVPESLHDLFQRQLEQLGEESSIRPAIQSLARIEDQVSKSVQAQYEENPYPRWVNTALFGKPVTISEVANAIGLRLSDKAAPFSSRPEILIAGCGTGQHALRTATRFLKCKVLAIDLSLNSLSYAIRKTRELGIGNVEYLQADILDLGSMGKQFDLVESVGVLHHMADPLEGWKILSECLKPGGLMKIGLYSELARKPIIAARQLISELSLSHTAKDMLQFRSAVLESEGEMHSKFGTLTNFNDFFSTSELRDLLFHVQEHRFTLPQINEALKVLGLTFVGFEFVHENIKKRFLRVCSAPQSVYSLDAWHEFELENTETFVGMYQFWVQKNARL